MAHPRFFLSFLPSAILGAALAGLLAACGGQGTQEETQGNAANASNAPAALASGVTSFGTSSEAYAQNIPSSALRPAYHLSPVLPEPPSGIDAGGLSLSAHLPPQAKRIPEQLQHMATRELSVARLVNGVSIDFLAQPDAAGPASSSAVSATYSPAQIRAAYGLPALPASYANLSAAQLAQYGAGQTIYVVDAYDDQQIVGELAAFNQLFGLPACNTKTFAGATGLALPAPSANACDFYKIYSNNSSTISSTAPNYDANWAVEIALDVQWAHAIAPLARIVLIEAPDASTPGLTGAIGLADQMGPGFVSMSFGGAEGSYVTTLDSYFQATGMNYFAATGDNGEAVSWPSVSPYVVAVGATSLTYTGTGSRTETAWSKTGGGVSAYEAAPSYQAATVPGMQTYGGRAAADVAFNGDPNTGQYAAVIPNQTTCTFCQVSWLTVGGTSLSTPQWAALAAMANAMRVQGGKSAIVDFHSTLYAQIASSSSAYASNFMDVTQGTDGTCSVCSTKKGYDIPTGLGTPNAGQLIGTLTGLSLASAPTVSGGISISGLAGKALTFTASVSGSSAYTMSLQNAPSGMTISSKAVVSWSSPVIGVYTVGVIATDSKSGLTGQGTYTVFVASSSAPVVSSGSESGLAGTALNFPVTVSDANPYTLSLSGAPSGMSISSGGLVSWPTPVAGSYTVTVKAADMINGLSATGAYSVVINKSGGPVVSSGNIAGPAGVALSFAATATNANAYTWSLAGAPSGMSIASSGTISWAQPRAGIYSVSAVAKDAKTGLTGTGNYIVNIGASGAPVISGSALVGKAGSPMSGTIKITDANSQVVGVSIGGAPLGMVTNASGGMNSFTVSWSKPVAGTYLLQVSATDAARNTTSAELQVIVTN
jgi:hypothetical protein